MKVTRRELFAAAFVAPLVAAAKPEGRWLDFSGISVADHYALLVDSFAEGLERAALFGPEAVGQSFADKKARLAFSVLEE